MIITQKEIIIIILAIISIILIIAKKRYDTIYKKYRSIILNENSELMKFILNELEDEEVIKSSILISMSDFHIFADNVNTIITGKVKNKIKNEGYEWLNLNSKHSSIYDSSYPIDLAISDALTTENAKKILYDKYINTIYNNFHYGMEEEQKAIEYYKKYGTDADAEVLIEDQDLHPAEVKNTSNDYEPETNLNMLYHTGTIEDEE